MDRDPRQVVAAQPPPVRRQQQMPGPSGPAGQVRDVDEGRMGPGPHHAGDGVAGVAVQVDDGGVREQPQQEGQPQAVLRGLLQQSRGRGLRTAEVQPAPSPRVAQFGEESRAYGRAVPVGVLGLQCVRGVTAGCRVESGYAFDHALALPADRPQPGMPGQGVEQGRAARARRRDDDHGRGARAGAGRRRDGPYGTGDGWTETGQPRILCGPERRRRRRGFEEVPGAYAVGVGPDAPRDQTRDLRERGVVQGARRGPGQFAGECDVTDHGPGGGGRPGLPPVPVTVPAH